MKRELIALAVALSLTLLVACDDGDTEPEDDPEPPPPRQLVDAAAWQPVEEAADLFAAMRTGRTVCQPVDSYGAVDFGGYPAFEVHTDFCDYVTVIQPLLDDVHEGEHVNVRMWHFEILAAEPAQGHVAVALEGEMRWEYVVELPTDSALASSGWVTDHAIPRGTEVQFHVRNHGINSWNLIEITAEMP